MELLAVELDVRKAARSLTCIQIPCGISAKVERDLLTVGPLDDCKLVFVL